MKAIVMVNGQLLKNQPVLNRVVNIESAQNVVMKKLEKFLQRDILGKKNGQLIFLQIVNMKVANLIIVLNVMLKKM